jgi:hypothetical protein
MKTVLTPSLLRLAKSLLMGSALATFVLARGAKFSKWAWDVFPLAHP